MRPSILKSRLVTFCPNCTDGFDLTCSNCGKGLSKDRGYALRIPSLLVLDRLTGKVYQNCEEHQGAVFGKTIGRMRGSKVEYHK